MEILLYQCLELDLRNGELNKNFQLSTQFKEIHRNFIAAYDERKYFALSPDINVQRKDQLLLNLQYNNLLYSGLIYCYDDYYRYVEEFLQYFLSYEMTTGRCSPQFIDNIEKIFNTLNMYHNM